MAKKSVQKKEEEKRACRLFMYVYTEARLPKSLQDFKERQIRLLPQFDDPTFRGEFREEFIETENVEIIYIGNDKLLDDYFNEVEGCYIPDHPNYPSPGHLEQAGLSWNSGDMVFLLVRRGPDDWYLKGGEYRPK